jgi:hypothetical protein
VSIRKINKKRLSRNFRLKHTPIMVLPLTTKGRTRHDLGKGNKERENHKGRIHSSPVSAQQPSVQCSIETMTQGKKQGRRKAPLTFHPFVTARFKMNALRWIFLSIIVALSVGTLFIMLQDGFGSMKNIIIYGAMGFFTFFMGYFGTIFAKELLDIIIEKKDSRNNADIET